MMSGCEGWETQVGHCIWKEKKRRPVLPAPLAQFVSRTYSPASFTCPVWHRRSVPIEPSTKETIVLPLTSSVSVAVMVAYRGLTGLNSWLAKLRTTVRPVSQRSKDTCTAQKSRPSKREGQKRNKKAWSAPAHR